MDIYEALSKVAYKKQEYFKWKFDLYVTRTGEQTEQELCEKLQIKSLGYMKKWEKSAEYQNLVHLYLESRIANDLEQIYEVTSAKALKGDEKAIKLLMDLQKQIRTFNKENKSKHSIQSNSNAYDELEL